MDFYYHPILGLQIKYNTNCGLINSNKVFLNRAPEWATQYKQVIKRTQTNL